MALFHYAVIDGVTAFRVPPQIDEVLDSGALYLCVPASTPFEHSLQIASGRPGVRRGPWT